MIPTADYSGYPEATSPLALALLGALRPGKFRTLMGYDAYLLWVRGELSNEIVSEMAGFTG